MGCQNVIGEYKGVSDSIVLTNEDIRLTFGGNGDRFIVDLMEGEHQFVVRYHDASIPLTSAYLMESDFEVEVETGVIEWLEANKFVYEKRVCSDSKEQTGRLPLGFLITVNMAETIKSLID